MLTQFLEKDLQYSLEWLINVVSLLEENMTSSLPETLLSYNKNTAASSGEDAE